MAETAVASNKTLEELEGEITCLVCQSQYSEAKLLPCMHYYCKECITELAKCSQNQSFPCPECRKGTTLPSGGADALQSAFFVERMKDLYGKMVKSEGKVETVCEMCTSGKATAFCRGCSKFCCTGCSSSHQESSPSEKHHVLILEKEDGSPVDPSPLCPKHNDPMTVFCFTCESVLCRDCIIMQHSGHKFNLLKECALEKRRGICNSLVPLRKIQAGVASADENLCKTEDRIDAQGEAIYKTIQESFGQLKALLQEREAELLSKTTALVQEKKDALAAQRKGLQVAQAEIQSLVEFVEQKLENTSDQDLMGISAELQTKVEEEEKRHQQLSLEPATTADIACDPPSLDVIPKKIGQVSCQPVVIQATKTCDVNKPATSTLYVPSFTEISILGLKSLVNPSFSVQAHVVQQRTGIYHISYTPRIRGRHDFTVKVDDTEISGSPFRVFVKIHPTQLGQPVRTITDISQPMGITFNRNKQLVVTECHLKQIAVLNQDGTRLRTIKSDDIKSPRGVGVGPEGTFFVTCNVTTGTDYSCLLKLNYSGQTLKAVGLQNPFCVRIIRDRLYVCDQGKVKIFDMNCNAVGNLTSTKCTQPYDVAEGNNGIYVVSNTPSGVIGKFTYEGEFREVFQQNLSRPRCICVNSNGFVFVTLGGGTDAVQIFHPNGTLVTSIGSRSSGILRSPTGIAIDEDGFVYVCDTNSQRLVVF